MFPDFEELLVELNAAGVRYIIGGAHALAFHARPRATKDLDIFVDPTPANARRLIAALRKFFGGAVPSYIDEETILAPDLLIQLGVAPVRVDLLSQFATITFHEAWRQSVVARFGAVPARYLSRAHLIREKEHFSRPQDLADLRALRAVGPSAAARKRMPRKRKVKPALSAVQAQRGKKRR